MRAVSGSSDTSALTDESGAEALAASLDSVLEAIDPELHAHRRTEQAATGVIVPPMRRSHVADGMRVGASFSADRSFTGSLQLQPSTLRHPRTSQGKAGNAQGKAGNARERIRSSARSYNRYFVGRLTFGRQPSPRLARCSARRR